jgi:hypothetical protein
MRHEGTGGTMQRSPACATVPCASERCHAFALHEAGPPEPTKPRLLDRVRAAARLRHYSRRTEAAYVAWIRRSILFHGKRHPAELGAAEVTGHRPFLQPAGDGGAVDQGGQRNHSLDAPVMPPFRANEVRLLLGVVAYNLGHLLRRLVLPLAIQSWSLTSLQQRLFKTGGRLIRHARYFVLQLAENYLTRPLFRQIVGRIGPLAWHPT